MHNERFEALADLAERQHNVVATWQARGLGIDRTALRRAIRRGGWEPAHAHVVRRRGAAPTKDERLMTAVLAAGPGAALSHRAAAAVWRLPGFAGAAAEVTVWRPVRNGGAGHRPTLVLPRHITEVRGLPVMTLPKTIFDLAGLREMRYERLLRLVSTVVGQSPAVDPALRQTLDELAQRGRPGIRKMRLALAALPAGQVPPTALERRFEEVLRRAGEPPLRRQVDLGGHSWIGRVDYVDPVLRVVAEVDSLAFHSSPADKARDAVRDRQLLEAGFLAVTRVAEEWIWYEPWRAVAAVRAARREARTVLGTAA